MRELTRSVASFTWTMSLFGVGQMANLMSPRRAADAFQAVARTTEELQRSMVDLSFRLAGMGPSTAAGAPSAGAPDLLNQVGNLAIEVLQLGVDTVYWMSGTAWNQQQGQAGWGPVPPPDGGSRP